MNQSLQNKNIILTGASRGFGKYLAGRLWDEGADIFQVARSVPYVVGRDDMIISGTRVAFAAADLAEDGAVSGVYDRANKYFQGKIDALINNAAIQGPVLKTWECPIHEWQQTISLDLMAPVKLCQWLVPIMLKQKHGKIINLSGGGAASPRPNYSAYATAKAGLVRFNECLAAELKGTGIDVNCVSPGSMLTDMTRGQPDAPSQAESDKRMKDAADLIIFLLSDESDGITGRLISAVWDDWRRDGFKEMLDGDPDIYTLRRDVMGTPRI